MRTIIDHNPSKPTHCFRSTLVLCIALLSVFAATDLFAKSYTFTWSASPEPIEGYKLYYKKGGEKAAPFLGVDATEGPSPILIGKQTTFTINGLEDNTTYHFALTAYNGSDESDFSEIVSVFDTSTPPPTGSTKQYSFTWSASPEPVQGYKLYYKKGGEKAAPFNGTDATEGPSPIFIGKQTSFTISGLEDNTTYHFALTAYNGSDESNFSEIVSVFDTSTSPPTSEPLTAAITTASQQGVAPFTLTFDGSTSTGSISSYNWSFGDGETATGATTPHIYQLPGTYTATLTVSNASGQTHQASATITATDSGSPPNTVTPPTVVISSSSAVGEAPFTVQFDGSGSTSAQPPIVSHVWDFGDGANGQGATVSRTFTTAGTYNTTLKVTDSAGLTNQASTPVIINAPPDEVNQEPTSSFLATPLSGESPLKVTFNGSGSSDADGTISDYSWSFGDGTSASGVSAEHTFTEEADYVVSLLVTDDKGATAVSFQTVSVLPPDEIDFELLEVQADSNWTKFTFSKPFINPVVVAGPPSYAGAQPALIRIRNVTPTGFEARIQEWDYLDGKHQFEKFSFIVMEKGIYTLDDGTKLEAGTFTGSTSFQKISLQQPYGVTPVILTQVATYNETDAVTGRMRNSSKSSFEFRMQEQQRNANSHKPETIGYIAWEPGKGEYAGLIYETGFTAKSVTHNWFNLTFKTTFAAPPLFIAGMQTYATDPAAVRYQNLTKTGVQIMTQEEQSKDSETSHAAEVVGYLSIVAAP
jgi:PKD repeat protein